MSLFGTAFAQIMPKPSVPQFSVEVVDQSYDVPTTYSTDPFTGKEITNPGYHVKDIIVEGKIKNQHFTAYSIPNPNSTSNYDTNLNIDFYYSIRFRGHFESEWRQLYGTRYLDFLIQNYGSEYSNFNATRGNAIEFQEGDVVDFQVKAIIGYETWGFVGTFPYRILNGEESGWSNILTVTISKDTTSNSISATTIDNSPYPTLTSPPKISTPTPNSMIIGTATPTPSSSLPSPSVPELPILVILPLFVSVLLVAV